MQKTLAGSLDQENPLQGAWQPTPVLLSGESHGQRRLAGYGPQGCKELDTTEATEHITQVNLTRESVSCWNAA